MNTTNLKGVMKNQDVKSSFSEILDSLIYLSVFQKW